MFEEGFCVTNEKLKSRLRRSRSGTGVEEWQEEEEWLEEDHF